MSEAKKPRLLKDPADWWKVSRYVPEGKQDVVLLALGGAAAFFLVLTVIALTELVTEGGEADEAGERVAELEADLEAARGETAEWKKSAEDAAAARAKVEERVAELAAQLEDAAARLAETKDEVKAASGEGGRLARLVESKDEEVAGLGSDLAAMKQRLADAMEYRKQAQELRGQLSKSEDELRAFRDQSAEALGEKAGLESVLMRETAKHEAVVDKLATTLERREGEILALADRIEEVEAELLKIPTAPLAEDGAARKYREFMDRVAEHTDRDERIGILFRAKLILAGTSYAPKAHAKWKKEQAEKQTDVDRKARAVYEEAMSKVESHRDSHDQNVVILSGALERVRGSKYEAVVQREIDRQHELKAQFGARN